MASTCSGGAGPGAGVQDVQGRQLEAALFGAIGHGARTGAAAGEAGLDHQVVAVLGLAGAGGRSRLGRGRGGRGQLVHPGLGAGDDDFRLRLGLGRHLGLVPGRGRGALGQGAFHGRCLEQGAQQGPQGPGQQGQPAGQHGQGQAPGQPGPGRGQALGHGSARLPARGQGSAAQTDRPATSPQGGGGGHHQAQARGPQGQHAPLGPAGPHQPGGQSGNEHQPPGAHTKEVIGHPGQGRAGQTQQVLRRARHLAQGRGVGGMVPGQGQGHPQAQQAQQAGPQGAAQLDHSGRHAALGLGGAFFGACLARQESSFPNQREPLVLGSQSRPHPRGCQPALLPGPVAGPGFAGAPVRRAGRGHRT